jgi:hypothetical protein
MPTAPTPLYAADPNTRRVTWGLAAPVVCLGLVIASQLAGSWILEHFVSLDRKGNPTDLPGLMAYTLVPFGLLLLILLAWVRWVEGRGARAIGLTREGAPWAFVAGCGAGLATLLAVVLACWGLGGFSASASPGPAPLVLLQMALLAPCIALQSSAEELLFRGWLLAVLTEKFKLVAGVVVSSALFSLMHFARDQTALAMASNFLFGVFCCCIAIRFRSVIGAMGWHSGWNWLLAVGFGLPLSGLDVGVPPLLLRLEPTGPHWLNGALQGPEASIACVLFFLAASAGLLATRPSPAR